MAYWRGDYNDAVDLAQNGQTRTNEPTDLLRLTSQEARALAAMGDEPEVGRALSAADDIRQAPSNASQPPSIFDFPLGKAAYYASEVRLTLGGETNARRALTDAHEALALLQGEQCAELKAAARLDLIAAHMALNDLEAAQSHAHLVLQLPAENRTVPLIGRVARIDQSLTSPVWTNVVLASDLREQFNLFCAYPAARELPEPIGPSGS